MFNSSLTSSVETLGPSLSMAPIIFTSLGSTRVVAIHPDYVVIYLTIKLGF